MSEEALPYMCNAAGCYARFRHEENQRSHHEWHDMKDANEVAPSCSSTAASDHRGLVEQAREHKSCCVGVSMPCQIPACLLCGESYPCLPARLASALEDMSSVAGAAQGAYEDLARESRAALEAAERRAAEGGEQRQKLVQDWSNRLAESSRAHGEALAQHAALLARQAATAEALARAEGLLADIKGASDGVLAENAGEKSDYESAFQALCKATGTLQFISKHAAAIAAGEGETA